MKRFSGTLWRRVAVALALLAAGERQAHAQEKKPGPVAEVAVGALFFADDGVVTEQFASGSVRYYVLPRISIGPELAFVQGRHHGHLIVTGNVTFDFLRPLNGAPRRATPFAVLGGGVFGTRELFPTGTFWSSDGAFTAGGGIRTSIGRRIVAGAEVRVGWELHVRVNALVGVRLGTS